MDMTNAEIAAVFAEIADWLELDAENPFRVRAYRNAARTIEAWPRQLADMVNEGREFEKLPGIGTDLGEKIGEILRNGTCRLLVRLRKSHPRGLTELLKVPGIGPRLVARLHRELGITTLPGLVRAARARRISTLKGFGRRSEDTLLQAAVAHLGSETRWSIAVASQHADAITEYLRGSAAVLDIAVAGSFRRRRETVGDLDVLVAARKPAQAAARFLAYPPIARVLARGSTRCSAILKSGLQIDLRVVAPHSFGSALVYFTGSKAHNIALRRGAQQRGLKINEYGVFRGATRVAGATEADVYAAVGLPLIAPELREDRGEIGRGLVERDERERHLRGLRRLARDEIEPAGADAKAGGKRGLRGEPLAMGGTGGEREACAGHAREVSGRRRGVKPIFGVTRSSRFRSSGISPRRHRDTEKNSGNVGAFLADALRDSASNRASARNAPTPIRSISVPQCLCGEIPVIGRLGRFPIS